eukprot:1597334-Pleurochrysis_carterae.AAC.1
MCEAHRQRLVLLRRRTTHPHKDADGGVGHADGVGRQVQLPRRLAATEPLHAPRGTSEGAHAPQQRPTPRLKYTHTHTHTH